MNGSQPVVLLALGSMVDLGQRIASEIKKKNPDGFSFAKMDVTTFANGEMKPISPVNLRHVGVYLLAPMQDPDPNTAVMQMLIACDAISRASARSLSLVLPYMPYSRQDRKAAPREPITARLLADLIQTNPSVKRVLTLDLHCGQLQGFYKIPVDNPYGAIVHSKYFRLKYGGDFSNVVVVSPDFGGATRAREFAEMLSPNVPVSIINKRRTRPNEAEALQIVGAEYIDGKDVIIYDDMIDTGGSIILAAKLALKHGARSITAAATHGVFSEKDGVSTHARFVSAVEQGLPLQVVITESIPRYSAYQFENQHWLTVLPLHDFLAEAIYQAATVGGSISSLFGTKKDG